MSEIEVYETHETSPATLFRTDDPAEVAARAIATADALMGVVNQRRRDLISVISGKDYPQVECWTLLGTLLGVFPVCEWTRPITDNEGTILGWEARVTAKTRDGSVVGAAESMCMFAERTWANRESFALRGMAESRATSRALRKPLGFVMKLAGLEATAAEEMDGVVAETSTGSSTAVQNSAPGTMPFGKHKGLPFADVPAEYLDWVLAESKDQAVKDAIVSWRLAQGDLNADPDIEQIPFG